MIGQLRDIVLASAQRRHEDRDYIQPEIEVFPKATGSNLANQILVRGRDYADVDFNPLSAADALHHLLLKYPQHLGLRLQAHIGDLVQENGSVVGLLEPPWLVSHRARESPAHVAE